MIFKKSKDFFYLLCRQVAWSILLLFFFACSVKDPAGNPGEPVPEGGIKAVTEFNAACMAENTWTGAVVLAGTTDKTVFRQSWGYTSTEMKNPMPTDAIFDLASVTKPVATATAVAVCADKGWLAISDPFTKYLTGYKGILKGEITLADLSRHISGFDNSKSYIQQGRLTGNLLEFSPVRKVGEAYEYSCYNYILLGMIVEKVSGNPLSEFCRDHIFGPLKMDETCWSPLTNPDLKRLVVPPGSPCPGVVNDGQARAIGRPVGNAGLFSTADDLAKICRMMLSEGKYGRHRVLSRSAVQMLCTRPDDRSPVAFGWRVDPRSNPSSLSENTLSHTGYTGNSIWIDPQQQCFVVVLTNRTGDHAQGVLKRKELAESVLRENRKELNLPADK